MKVRALNMGYFGHARIRPGVVFELPEEQMKLDKDGKPVLPLWVEPANAKSSKVEKELSLPGVKVKHGKREGKGLFGGSSKSSDESSSDSDVI